MKSNKSPEEQRKIGLTCLAIVFLFLGVGIFANRTFVLISIVFFFLAISQLAPSRPKP